MVRMRGAYGRWLLTVYNICKYIYIYILHSIHDARRLARRTTHDYTIIYHLAKNFLKHYTDQTKLFRTSRPSTRKRQGRYISSNSQVLIIMYIFIYGPSIRKTPHTHIHHPVLRKLSRHHRPPPSVLEKKYNNTVCTNPLATIDPSRNADSTFLGRTEAQEDFL